MSIPSLRLLIVDDDGDDADLVLREVQRAFDVVAHLRVDTASTMLAALQGGQWDICTLDFSLPNFDAMEALEIAQQHALDMPCIIVSGVIDATAAIAAMRAGSRDYVMKDDLTRLIPAIEREIEEAEGRKQRERAERALHESEAQLRAVFETVPTGLSFFDMEKNAIRQNHALAEMLGYSREEFLKVKITDLFGPEDFKDAQQRLGAIMRGGAGDETPIPGVLRHKDGHPVEVTIQLTPLDVDARRTGMVAVVRDISDEVRLRNQLVAAQKAEALGTLTAGIAHDFNNLLTSIGASAELAKSEPSNAVWLDNIVSATERAAKVVRHLMQYAHRETPDRRPVVLTDTVGETLTLARETFDRRIELEEVLNEAIPPVDGDAGQLGQVVLNLLLNARDAVIERLEQAEELSGYTPHIGIRLCTIPNDDPALGPLVRLTVSDNGLGIAPEVQVRIFDPFFTTKDVGSGTGLGLSTAAAIVSKHGGTLTVESTVGVGSTFMVALPPSGALSNAPDIVETQAAQRILPVGRSVLVVDDESQILRVEQAILQSAGYEVTTASSGHAALEAIHRQDFDVAVLDLNMRSPDGWEVLAKIRESGVDTKVLVASGFAREDEVIERGGNGFLQKPFTGEGLVTAVSSLSATVPTRV